MKQTPNPNLSTIKNKSHFNLKSKLSFAFLCLTLSFLFNSCKKTPLNYYIVDIPNIAMQPIGTASEYCEHAIIGYINGSSPLSYYSPLNWPDSLPVEFRTTYSAKLQVFEDHYYCHDYIRRYFPDDTIGPLVEVHYAMIIDIKRK